MRLYRRGGGCRGHRRNMATSSTMSALGLGGIMSPGTVIPCNDPQAYGSSYLSGYAQQLGTSAAIQQQMAGAQQAYPSPHIYMRPTDPVSAMPDKFNTLAGRVDAIEKSKPKGEGMIETVKCYINKHRDFLFTVILVMVVDHFVFKGALREKIKGVIDGALNKANDNHQKEA